MSSISVTKRTFPGNPTGNAASSRARHALAPTLVSVAAALCAALALVKLSLVGDLFLSELLLPIVAAIAASSGGQRVFADPAFKALFAASMLTLLGYILSDLAQGSRPDQFLRGWGRVALVISDFVCLSIIFGQDKRNFWWYSLGAGLGNILYLSVGMQTPLSKWKFGYADPIARTSITLGAFVPLRMLSVWLVLLGLHSMWSDFRSFAGLCLAVAAILWVQAGDQKRGGRRGGAATVKLLIAGAVAAIVISVTMSLTVEQQSAIRRLESNSGREAAIEVGIKAILRSPVIGYGSWAENKELAAMYTKRTNQLNGGSVRGSVSESYFAPHSQILHAWMEGGILGAALFFSLAYYLLKTSYWLVKTRPVDYLTPLLLYSLIIVIFNLFMSPFSASHRLGIATGAALIVMLNIERRRNMPTPLKVRQESSVAVEQPQEQAPARNRLRSINRTLHRADRRLREKTRQLFILPSGRVSDSA